MPAWLCATCGLQYADTADPPPGCPVCEDERQWVPPDGQRWTTPADLEREHTNDLTEVEPGLTAVRTRPRFAIGQRALHLATPAGGLLWDCVSLLDVDTVAAVGDRGGVAAIAISHPHFYAAAAAWSDAFDGAPVWIHADDRSWWPGPARPVRFWAGETAEPLPGLTLLRLGGHFDGAAALHWPAGAAGRGALLTGDTVQVVPDAGWVSVMYSYPNYIPVSEAVVRRIAERLAALRFDRVHGAFGSVDTDGSRAVADSLRRYADRVSGRVGG